MSEEGNKDLKIIAWVLMIALVWAIVTNLLGIAYIGITGELVEYRQQYLMELIFYTSVIGFFQDGFSDIIADIFYE